MIELSQESNPPLAPSANQNPVLEQKTQQLAPAPIDPGLIALAEIVKDGFLKNQEKDVEALKIELRSRFHISIVIVIAILTIILSIVYLTVIGKFDISIFAFLLGTSVGSLLTIMGKMFSSNGQWMFKKNIRDMKSLRPIISFVIPLFFWFPVGKK